MTGAAPTLGLGYACPQLPCTEEPASGSEQVGLRLADLTPILHLLL